MYLLAGLMILQVRTLTTRLNGHVSAKRETVYGAHSPMYSCGLNGGKMERKLRVYMLKQKYWLLRHTHGATLTIMSRQAGLPDRKG